MPSAARCRPPSRFRSGSGAWTRRCPRRLNERPGISAPGPGAASSVPWGRAHGRGAGRCGGDSSRLYLQRHDLALGFILSEAVIDTPAELVSLEVIRSALGVELRMWIAEIAVARYGARR